MVVKRNKGGTHHFGEFPKKKHPYNLGCLDQGYRVFGCPLLRPKGLQHRTGVTFFLFSPTAESFGVSAQIGSGVVWGGPEVRFHDGSTRVPRGSARWCEHYKEDRMLLGISPELVLFWGEGRGETDSCTSAHRGNYYAKSA